MITRRTAIGLLGGAAMAATGPFEGTRESLKGYRIPEWFRDAKLGMWAHWGPQSAPEQGDWYAQRMYLEGSPAWQWHVANCGHPSKVGFKDVIATFRGEKFDAEHLMDLYSKAGAKYFVSMGVHHDNFDMWNSKFQPRWNAVATGPKKDVVGLFRQAARKRGLRFGVSEHLSNSFDWLAPAHRADKKGPYAGVPYDGNDENFADLYHSYKDMPADFAQTAQAMGRVAPERWKQQYFNRIKDLIDQHEPDLLYTDGAIPFEDVGLSLVAHHYNVSAKRHKGQTEAVYCSKSRTDCATGTCALDLERGIVDRIWDDPWQTDTCIGGWHYKRDITYKTPKIVIDMFVDIVSRNGNLLLNFPLPGSGAPDDRELAVLSAITDWMKVNHEGIYASRPWRVYGEGPSTMPPAERQGRLGFNETGRKDLTPADIRFTLKGKDLYAFVMGWPGKEAVVKALAREKIHNVELLGHKGKLRWSQDEGGLKVEMPEEKPCEFAYALKVVLA